MLDITLRDYQEECVDVIDRLDPGSYLVVMATGLGKTAVFSHIRRRGRVLILSHREELVHQPEKFYDCPFGVERAEESSHGEEVISASVQTLVRRLDKFQPDDFDILITDEAHHAVAPSYLKIYDYFKPRLHLGFTATPNRADNAMLGEVYSEVIFEKDIRWGIEHGYLTDIRCEKFDIGYDLGNVRTQMGDFNQGDLERAVDIEQCNLAVADIYNKHAIGQTLIFAASVKHANRLAELIPGAYAITNDTPDRADILRRFADGDIKVIVNCMVLTEGTDLPMVRTIIMCRPTQNASLFTQIVGRGLRPYPGKPELLLIDCTGASKLPLCSAPILFGLLPTINVNGRLLTEVTKEIEEKKQEPDIDLTSWKINITLVDMFEKNGNYDTFGVNYTICQNGDMVCSAGDGITISLSAEDMVGNTNITISEYGFTLYQTKNVPMQKALEIVFKTLKSEYSKQAALWDRSIVEQWGKQGASEKQKNFIRRLYRGQQVKDLDYNTLTKYQAMCLIDRALEQERQAGKVYRKSGYRKKEG